MADFVKPDKHLLIWLTLISILLAAGCQTPPGVRSKRSNDVIMVAGEGFHTTTKVVLWTDTHGGRMAHFPLEAAFFNVNTPDDLITAEAML